MPGMRSPGPPLPSGTGNPQMGMPGMRSAAPPPPPGAASSQQMARPPGPPRSTAPPLGTAVSTANPAGKITNFTLIFYFAFNFSRSSVFTSCPSNQW